MAPLHLPTSKLIKRLSLANHMPLFWATDFVLGDRFCTFMVLYFLSHVKSVLNSNLNKNIICGCQRSGAAASKKGQNYVKTIFRLPALLVWVPLLIVNN